jgi:hypothetical protein
VVNFAGDRSLEGELVSVQVTAAKTNSLYGALVNSSDGKLFPGVHRSAVD